jgi:hypothetical protein
MKMFGQLVRTVVNVALLPVAVTKDVLTLGGAATGEPAATPRLIQQIKDDAGESE